MDKKSPQVSLGMPIFNGENYLEDTLDSILAQTFTDFELIISDNASTDRTREICLAYQAKDSRIHYTRNEKNLGAAKNYNLLFDLARGEYFKWVAHDDPCAPEYLEYCVNLFNSEADAVMCYPRTILIDENDEVIEYHDDGFDLRSPKAGQRLRKSFYSSAWCHPVFGLIRANVLKQTDLIGNYASSDKVLLAELAMLGKCCEVPKHLAYRRLHPQNSTETHTSDEAMAAWFDPAARKKVLAPRWRRLIELYKFIKKSPLSKSDRLGCYLELGRFYLSIGRLAGVAKDMKQMSKRVFQIFSRDKQENLA